MSNEIAVALIGAIVAIARILSYREHRKTGKDVKDIKIYINGSREKELEKAKEEGREERKK